MRLAIVIPCYNGAERLHIAVDSVISQSRHPSELIIVDDGSNDGSGGIADRYAEEYPWIRVVHTDNQGLPAARNVGIDESDSDYVGFLDADDQLDPFAIEGVHSAIEEGYPDLVRIGFCREYNGSVMSSGTKVEPGLYCGPAAIRELADHFWFDGEPAYSWLFYVKRSVFDRVRFDDSVKYLEDAVFLADLLPVVTNVLILTNPWYIYYQNAEGMVRGTAHAVRNAIWSARVANMVMERQFLDEPAEVYRSEKYAARQLDLLARRLVSDVRRGALDSDSFHTVSDRLEAEQSFKALVERAKPVRYSPVTAPILRAISHGHAALAWRLTRAMAYADSVKKALIVTYQNLVAK